MLAARRVAAVGLFALTAMAPIRAEAWKPYTHNYTGSEILDQIDFANSRILIAGGWYSIPVEATLAIANNVDAYFAGTVGPDGFPDLTYGQAVIHPGGVAISEGTGAWLKYILDSAWQAYRRGDADGEKSLAFAYGFLTHAAGDVWGHTAVNEMSHGVFPGVGEILTSVDKAAEAIRHIIAEGYIGEATPGFDGNPGFELYGTDWTDSSTPGYAYDVPHGFLFSTLVAASAPTPIAAVRGSYMDARGPLIGTFLELRDGLNDFVPDPPPDPLQAAVSAYDDTLDALESVRSSCDFRNISDLWNCPADLADLGFDIGIDSVEAFGNLIVAASEDLAYAVLGSYLHAWVADIDTGLSEWSHLGLATTRGLFDAQTRRSYQNAKCNGEVDVEGCKAAVGTFDVVMNQIEPLILNRPVRLLSMAGAPDVALDVITAANEILGGIGDFVDDVLAYAGLPFRPFEEAAEAVSGYVKALIENAIWNVLGVDIQALADVLKTPTRYICASDFSFDLPGVGPTTIPLFASNEHQRLDDYLLLPAEHHVQLSGIPPTCGRLVDGVKYSPATFSPITDTIQMGKLLLLDGPELNRLLGDKLGRTIVTYGAGDNIMGRSTDGTLPWLALIDGDHAWRVDGRPVFTDRNGERTGGNGTFPLWKSCVLRPAFRTLFADWENPWNGRGPGPGTTRIAFPELGDRPAEDPANDPLPPTSTLEAKGNVYVDPSGRTFVGSNAWLVLSAHDGPRAPANLSFADADVKTRYRITAGSSTGAFVEGGATVDAILLTQGDGPYAIEYHSADPCHEFDTVPNRVGAAEALRRFELVRDGEAPAVTCQNPPFGATFATAAYSAANFTMDDGGMGSGVASFSATIDGDVFAADPVPIAQGGAIDMFRYWPGLRTVSVTAADHLGNSGTTACTFELHATTKSLIANLIRARDEGSVPDAAVFQGLMDKLVAADKSDVFGRPTPEVNQLEAFVNQLLAQRGQGIVALRADQLIAYARDLVAHVHAVSSL